jgi:hypothetical protein
MLPRITERPAADRLLAVVSALLVAASAYLSLF